MNYAGINAVAKAIADKLKALGPLKTVKTAPITGSVNAGEAVGSAVKFPAAIVCLAAAEPKDAMFHRDLVFQVIVVCPFTAESDAGAVAAWDLLDTLEQAFAPDADGNACALAGQPCFAGSSAPLGADINHSCYVFNVNVR